MVTWKGNVLHINDSEIAETPFNGLSEYVQVEALMDNAAPLLS